MTANLRRLLAIGICSLSYLITRPLHTNLNATSSPRLGFVLSNGLSSCALPDFIPTYVVNISSELR